MKQQDSASLIKWGLDVIEIEAQAIHGLTKYIDNNFAVACNLILACSGRVIVIGMGKSGHIAKKIAATFSSTGTPAFFVHPGEAIHGDLGMITNKDVVIALSHSGETDEIINILPMVKRLGVKLISITGNKDSTIAKHSDCNILIQIEKEACSLGLAPTASSTAMLVLGDALAISLLNAKNFTADDFALSHPGGKLGRRLLIRISDIMHTGDKVPVVSSTARIVDALVEMSQKRLGFTAVIDQALNKMVGVFTDGDLRRVLDKGRDIQKTIISEVMTKQFKFISSNVLAEEAICIMEQYKVLALPVIDDGKLVGAFNMHDLFNAKIM